MAFSLLAPTPLGDYRSIDKNNEKALCAKGGMGFGLEGAYFFLPYIGIGAMCAGISNKVDEGAFDQQLEQQFADQGLSLTAVTKANSNWVEAYMAGIYGTFPIKTWSLDVKMLGGGIAYQFPNIRATISDGQQQILLKASADKTTGFGLSAGMGARIKLSNQLALRATLDYLQGTVDARVFETLQSQSGQIVATDFRTHTFTISMINFGIGLAYQINKEK